PFLEEPAVEATDFDHSSIDSGCGDVVGPYKLLHQIGEGGMGVVYRAAQQSPLNRDVALKIIKPGMDTRRVVDRFQAERQALALMEHPHIARVLDAGETEFGRPYFVMELIRGVSIIEFCQQERLSLAERLRLFSLVCDAIQHAHIKGVIHRDIKPSNILVACELGRPIPKIIDFGVAKAIHGSLSERSLHTEDSQILGTPLYMSPEQVERNGLDVDTRTDVYSLGITLYELLTGEVPVVRDVFEAAGIDEQRRMIREDEPQRPSVRVSILSRDQITAGIPEADDPARLGQLLRGELDWICIKSLEKDRTRRYQSAQELRDDVERYLSGDAVTACPPSLSYRLRTVLRRHRGLVASVLAIVVLLVLGTGVATWFAFQAHQAELQSEADKDRADREAAVASAISAFLSNDLLRQASPYEDPNRDIKLREVLEKASARIDGRFPDQPLVEAEIRTILGTTFRQLADYDAAREHLNRASELRSREFGADHPDTLRSAFERGLLALKSEGTEAAENFWKPTLQRQMEILGPDHHDTLVTTDWLAWCYTLQGRFAEAERLYADAAPRFERVLGPDHPDTLDCLEGKARLLTSLKRYDEAGALNERVLAVRRRVLGDDHPQTDDSLGALALVKAETGQMSTAVELLETSPSVPFPGARGGPSPPPPRGREWSPPRLYYPPPPGRRGP
ncbi:MAG: serine/threonine protein kinase, partial [Planctomycetaceae bacterium]|nr:serine/threonine protein kinase [Planctomycetaceae bacterium]